MPAASDDYNRRNCKATGALMKKYCFTLFAVLCCVFILSSASSGSGLNNKNAKHSLRILMEGNQRFVEQKTVHPHQNMDRVKEIAPKQKPIAMVLSCSDSRVPPEIFFDQGLGDIFIVRVAGNVLNDVNIGSAEYAAEHLNVPLIIVLGHKSCGAVKAAVAGGEVPGHISSIVKELEPAVREAKKTAKSENVAEAAAHINVENVVKKLSNSEPILSELIKEKKLSVIGAYYDVDTGKVDILK